MATRYYRQQNGQADARPWRPRPVRFTPIAVSGEGQPLNLTSDPPLPSHDVSPDKFFTEKKALETAYQLMNYWQRQGHHQVRAWAERRPYSGYVVRSNLVGGLPPRD